MGLFDSETETRTTSRTAPRSDQESQLLNMLQSLSSRASGQIGDMSGLARGELPGMSEGMLNMLQTIADEMFGREERGANLAFEEGLTQASQTAAAQGQTDSSQEAMFRAIAGRDRGRTIEDARSRSEEFLARQRIALPQQQAQQMLDVNSLLYQMASQPAGAAMQGLLQDRMSNLTTTSTTEAGGGLLSSLSGLGSSLSGLGGMDFGALFNTGGSGGSSARPSQFSTPIGPGIGGQPMGTLALPPRQGPGLY